MSTSLNSIAYKHIRGMILTNRIAPGQRLSEARLASELEVGRTPVREAIRQLCSDGVLYQVPSSGTFVVVPGREEIIEAYQIRELLECSMLRLAMKKFLPRHRKELREQLQKMRTIARQLRDSGEECLTGELLHQFIEADMAMHQLILKVAGNKMALRIVDDAQLRNRSFGNSSHRRDLEHIGRTLLYHARFARAIGKGDSKMAIHWMRGHIRESRHDALERQAESEE